MGIDIKAGQGRFLSDEMFELLGANCNEEHFPHAGPCDRLLLKARTKQRKPARQ